VKPNRFVLVLLGVFAGACAALAQPASQMPPPAHPTAILSVFNGTPLPVMGVSRKKPEVMVNGVLQKLAPEAGFAFSRANHYAPGRVEISNEHGESDSMVQTSLGNPISAQTDLGIIYSADLVATQSYRDCYVVLVLFNKNYLAGYSDQPLMGFFFRSIGRLDAGRKKHVAIDVDGDKVPRELRPRLGYFLLVFSGGAEIESNQAGRESAFFRRGEILAHQRRLKEYLLENSTGDRPLRNYLEIAPVIPAEIPLATLPVTIEANCTVSAEGTVDSVEPLDSVPAPAAREISRAISGWLFLPRIQQGRPQPAKVQVTVTLRDAPSP
jgi:hypothetical protein